MENQDFWEKAKQGEKIDLFKDERFEKICLEEIKRCRELCFRLNSVNPNAKQYRELLSELFMQNLDETTYIEPGIQIDYGRQVKIGKNVFIGNGFSASSFGGITIEDNAMIAFRCSVATVNHLLEDLSVVNGFNVEIGKGAWIGANVTILPGVSIGDGAVIGAGSVVTKSIPPFAVAYGNPAKIIKYREDKKV